MERDKSISPSILKRHWIRGVRLFPPRARTRSHSYTCSYIHAGHSCWFISGAELKNLGQRHVQPQLQIDRLSSPVASASFTPSAQHIFILSYCSYCRSLSNKRTAMKESKKLKRTTGLKREKSFFVHMTCILSPHFFCTTDSGFSFFFFFCCQAFWGSCFSVTFWNKTLHVFQFIKYGNYQKYGTQNTTQLADPLEWLLFLMYRP